MNNNFENHSVEESGTDEVITKDASMDYQLRFSFLADKLSELQQKIEERDTEEIKETISDLKKFGVSPEKLNLGALQDDMDDFDEETGVEKLKKQKKVLEKIVSSFHDFVENYEDSSDDENKRKVKELNDMSDDLARLQKGIPEKPKPTPAPEGSYSDKLH